MPDYTIDPNDPLPRYYQVYHSLLERIRAGEFEPGDALPSERQLTQDYGVSRITIVKALDVLQQDGRIDRQHGRGTFVTEPQTNAGDEALSIAFLPGVFDHPYLFNVLMGIARVATQQHCHLQVMGAYENSSEETHYVNEVVERGIDGLIVYPHAGYKNVDLYRRLREQDFPFVMIDRYYPQVETDRVTFDDEEAGFQLTNLLLKRGHRRIAVVPHHEVEVTSVRDRLAGYRRAVTAHGLAYDEDLVWLDVYSTFYPLRDQDKTDAAFTHRLRRRLDQDQPTALLAINRDIAKRLIYDLMAIRTDRMRAVIEGNSRRQDYDLDIELASFSHNTRADYGPAPVPLAVHAGETLGERAAELLIGRLTGEVAGPPRAVAVPMQISYPKQSAPSTARNREY